MSSRTFAAGESNVNVPQAPRGLILPFVGSLPGIVRKGTIEFMMSEWKTHGDVFRVQLGARPAMVVVHPDHVEKVLGSGRENYVKGPTYDIMRLLTGDGLLTLEGDAWRVRRRMENPAFHRESIRSFVSQMATITRQAIAYWRWKLPNGGTFDAHHEMMRLTLEIVSSTLFGQRLGEQTGENSGAAFGDALKLISERGNSPLQLPLAIPTPGNVRFRRALQNIETEVAGIIKHARSSPRDPKVPHLLGMLLDLRDAETGLTLSDKDLRNEVITLFLAGHETTALLLTWGFTLLARAPEVVARAREEVRRVVGDRDPTADDLPRLTYLRQVVDEILRLRPPVWAVARDAVADETIGGYRVNAGDVVMPAMYLTHRHPAFWDEPERFDPDRFSPERAKGRNHWAYYPFSLGPRICIGNTFSLSEAQVILALFLATMDFSMDDPNAVRPEAAVTMRPSGPVPLKIRWRS